MFPRTIVAGLRRAAWLAVVLLLTGGIAACRDDAGSASADGPVQLSVFWWGGQERATRTERALQVYTQRHPEVTFRVTWQGPGGYYERLATQAGGGNPPDLFQLDDSYLTEYAQRDIVLDLTSSVDSRRLDLSRLSPGLVQYGTVAGRLMAVAAAENTPAIVYNRDLLRRLGLPEPFTGMSYDDFLDWARRVTDSGGGRVAGTMDASADIRAFWVWLRASGRELYQGPRLACTATEVARWFELWQRARASRATPSAAVVQGAHSDDLRRQLVVTGRAATSFVWSHQLPELQRQSRDTLGIAAYPGDPEAQWARASMYWAGYRGTRHPETVADVINFLTNDPDAGRILGNDRGLSANLDVRRLVGPALTEPGAKLAAEFETDMSRRFGPAPPPPPRGHDRIRALLVEAAEDVQSGRRTSRTAAEDFVRRANAALAG
ncbi:ABC transporter substrate-binding protein [Plantactinospora sp. GCM10030261]|uniref:ABC transporter substrate-binding protein n=1 Tax=Plantactinospora sp. GCM10030261 TaxID=3273420 RepID=UPI003611B695